jgi:amino-acid N-acetyltransferase
MEPEPSSTVTVRRARTSDVPHVKRLVDAYADRRILLAKNTVTLYEDVQEFWVAEGPPDEAGVRPVVGCGALHVLWEDLGEIRTLAVDPIWRGRRIGDLLVERLVAAAVELGLGRIFVLTFEVAFFLRHGFVEIDGTPVEPAVFEEMLRSYDEGVAEFLDLEYVKPNTLGNSRMLRHL